MDPYQFTELIKALDAITFVLCVMTGGVFAVVIARVAFK